jgi:cytochrome c oxidase cbb3-type subunit III
MRFFWVLVPSLLMAQSTSNELAQGKSLFRGNCAFCHGATGEGGRGPNLVSGTPVHGASDTDLRRVISKGIPGTPMPSFGLEHEEMDRLVVYVKSLRNASVAPEKGPGDAIAGKAVYEKLRCSACHRIGGEGSVYGPELTRIGSGRPLAYLRQSIVDPSADVPSEYETVTVVNKDGKKISGIRINEDTFSVQLRTIGQDFLMIQKDEVKEVRAEKRSLMPPFAHLPQKDLDDLVSYLMFLRSEVSQ